MAKVNFPNSPSDGQTFTSDGTDYIYNSSKGNWGLPTSTSGLQLSSLSVGANAPAAGSGDVAYDNNTGVFTYTPPVVEGSSVLLYATPDDLPLVGSNAGDQAYVTSTNRLYIWNGTGWFNIALINTNPTITTGGAATYELARNGSATTITLAATDPEDVPIAWSYAVTAGSLGSTATVSQADNVFTVTPSSTEADAGTFSLTFTASDGVNIATSTSAFTLSFSAPILAGTLLTTIYNPSPSSTDNFADRGCLMNDDYYVIGSWNNTPANSKVLLFNRSNGNLAYTIVQPTATQYDRFGVSAAISGNYLLVGDISGDTVYLYDISTFSSSTITSANYTLSDPNYNSLGGSNFASSGDLYAISGNYIAISNFSSSVGGTVYVYDISTFSSSTINSANYNLTNPNKYGSSSSNDNFGISVAVDGNILVVGSREESSGGSSDDGVVYVYDISNFSSSVISSADFSIDNPDYGSSNDGDDRHWKVAVSQDYIAVGAMFNSEPFYQAGTIYIYDTSNGNLLYTVASPSATEVASQWFGYSLALDGNNLYGQVYNAASWTIYHYDISSFTSSTPAVIAAGTGIENTLSAPISGNGWAKSGNWWAYDGKLIVGAADESATDGSGGTLTNSGVAYVYE